MGLIVRRRVRTGANSWLNVSTSGVSASKRAGRVTVNTRGGVRVKLGKGWSYRLFR
jgi:hypothetical protein